jgi:hypothetical protein
MGKGHHNGQGLDHSIRARLTVRETRCHETPRVIRLIFRSRQMGTSCTESVREPRSQTLWIHPSFMPHSITSSARTSNVCGTSSPSVFAVCRLMANENLVGCNTGNSAGFAPLRMRPT